MRFRSDAILWIAGALVALLPNVSRAAEPAWPPVVLDSEQIVLSAPQRNALGLAENLWSDSTLSLINLGQHEILYGTAASGISTRCDGLVGFTATGVDDIAHPGTLPRFEGVVPRPAAHSTLGCLAASPYTPNLPRYQTTQCQSNPACIAETPFDNDYAGLTSVVTLRNGWLAGFVHGETHFWTSPGQLAGGGFYGRIGLFVSRDGGRSFQQYSTHPILTGNVRFATIYNEGLDNAFDISGGAAVVAPDGIVRVYYSDEYDALPPGDPDQALAASCSVCIAVAGISLDDLTDAIVAGRMPQLRKYYRGSFSQPALGGRFTPIVTPDQAANPAAHLQEEWIVWPSVGYVASRHLYVMAYMSGWGGTRIRTSPDGLGHWSSGMFISPYRYSDQPGDPIPAIPYPTIIGDGGNFHLVSSDAFYLYYQSASWIDGGFDWPQSNLVRRRVSLSPERYVDYIGDFSFTGGFLGYSNGQRHYCTIANAARFRQLGGEPAQAYTLPHIQPSLVGWTDDGPCLGG